MKKHFYLTSVALFSLLTLSATQATAFSVNEGSNGAPANAQLADPDDKLPVPTLNLSGASKDGSQDAASVHYDYDPENGTFVPHSPANDK